MNRVSLLPILTLLTACSTVPPEADATPRPAPVEAPEPVRTPPKPVPAPKPPAPAPLNPDELCPPPKGPETERAQIIRKLDCLLTQDRS